MSSPAGAPSGDAGQTQQQADGQAQQGPDIGALSQQMEQYGSTLEDMRNFLQTQPWTQQAEGTGEPEPAQENLDLSFLDEAGYDQQAANQLAQIFENQMQQRESVLRQEFQKELSGVKETLTERQQMEHMRDLVDEFPDMAQPDVAQQIVQQAHQLAEANGWPQEMAADPRFWRVTYMAQQAAKAAQEEGRGDPGAAHLEGGAGAASAGGQRESNDILQALEQPNTAPDWLRGR